MFVFEITDLFRQYCDEPDVTWLTPADVSNYLATGYREFRWQVSNLAPYTYATNVLIPAAGNVTYDLADPANATVERCYRASRGRFRGICRCHRWTAGGQLRESRS